MDIPLKTNICKDNLSPSNKYSASTDTATSTKFDLNKILICYKNGTNKLQVPAMLVYYP